MTDVAPEKCDYCGKPNPDRFATCVNCGTVLATPAPGDAPQPGKKSRLLAVSLAILFGPLGLIYVRAWVPAAVMLLISFLVLLTRHGALWVVIGVRILAALWAYCAVSEQDEAPNAQRDSKRLLDQAARLESTDKIQAMAVYEQTIREYPDTSASREAARNIEALGSQKPS